MDELLDALQYGPDEHPPYQEDESSPLHGFPVGRAGSENGTVIEVTGPSCSGKTHLLYVITAQGVLPQRIGGREGAVVVLDADGRFDVARLYEIMMRQVEEGLRGLHDHGAGNIDGDVECMIQEALRHVHIFQPQSLASLVATVEALPQYLLQKPSSRADADPSTEASAGENRFPRHYSSNRVLHAVLLDSASAFYWEDRLEQDLYMVGETSSIFASRTSPAGRGKRPVSATSMIMASLRSLQKTFPSAVVVVTTWDLASGSMPSLLFRQSGSPAPVFFYIQLTRRKHRVLVSSGHDADMESLVNAVTATSDMLTDESATPPKGQEEEASEPSPGTAQEQKADPLSPAAAQSRQEARNTTSNATRARIDATVTFLSNQVPREEAGHQAIFDPLSSVQDGHDDEDETGEANATLAPMPVPENIASDAAGASEGLQQGIADAGDEEARGTEESFVHAGLRDDKRRVTRLVVSGTGSGGGGDDWDQYPEEDDGDGEMEFIFSADSSNGM